MFRDQNSEAPGIPEHKIEIIFRQERKTALNQRSHFYNQSIMNSWLQHEPLNLNFVDTTTGTGKAFFTTYT